MPSQKSSHTKHSLCNGAVIRHQRPGKYLIAIGSYVHYYLLLVAGQSGLLLASLGVPHGATAVRTSAAHEISADVHGDHCRHPLVRGALLKQNAGRMSALHSDTINTESTGYNVVPSVISCEMQRRVSQRLLHLNTRISLPISTLPKNERRPLGLGLTVHSSKNNKVAYPSTARVLQAHDPRFQGPSNLLSIQ